MPQLPRRGRKRAGLFPCRRLASIATNAAFVTPGDRNKSLLYTAVATGRMPYGKRPSAGEVEALGQWIDKLNESQTEQAATTRPAGAPAQRAGMAQFRPGGANDINQVNDRDRKFMRYFSYRAQYNGKLPCEDEATFDKRMDFYRAGFHKLLNSVSLGNSLVLPEVVPGTKDLLVRVDIRDLKWDDKKWDFLVSSYPFGYDPKSDGVLNSLSQDIDTQLPIMRVDWFMANAARPDNYHELLELPKKISDLEKTSASTSTTISSGGALRGRAFLKAPPACPTITA